MDFTGKVVVITGGAKGIGKGCAKVFCERKASVAIVDWDAAAGNAARDDLITAGGSAVFIEADISTSEGVKRMVTETLAAFGRINVLVNNAGTHISKNILDQTEEEWDRVQRINLKSYFLCSKYALPELIKTKGSIVNMSSMVGVIGQSKAAAYSATKGGIVAMSKGMALDMAPYGVRVNVVCPGWVQTPLVEDWFNQQPDPEAARNYIYSVHPLGRIATVEEVGKAVAFLAGDDASFVTGVALPVDGAVSLGY
ncbi:MAG: SDR family oxidoreductase [Armatimonadetes bacterium]|nr:SDR family oxidoreductase [Armatimonadota bacterium]